MDYPYTHLRFLFTCMDTNIYVIRYEYRIGRRTSFEDGGDRRWSTTTSDSSDYDSNTKRVQVEDGQQYTNALQPNFDQRSMRLLMEHSPVPWRFINKSSHRTSGSRLISNCEFLLPKLPEEPLSFTGNWSRALDGVLFVLIRPHDWETIAIYWCAIYLSNCVEAILESMYFAMLF